MTAVVSKLAMYPVMFPCPVMYIINLSTSPTTPPVLTIIITQDVSPLTVSPLQGRFSHYSTYLVVFKDWEISISFLEHRIDPTVKNPIKNFQISNSNVCSNKSNLIIKLKAAKNDKSLLIEKIL